MNGGEPDRWSAVAEEWSALWGSMPQPVWAAVAAAAAIGPGSRVLDIGCGAGEFVAYAAGLGAEVSGVDPAPGMVSRARARVPGASIEVAGFEELPRPERPFDVATAFNALQFAEDPVTALRRTADVVAAGGRIAIANWAEAERNDIEALEAAIARAAGEEPVPDDELRLPGGLERVMAAAGLADVLAGITDVEWTTPDEEHLVRGILLGEDDATIDELRSTLLEAAAPYRTAEGGYRLVNAFRWAVGTAGR
ncbi:class I SAM-dependent methyltransferase [Lysobacter korlensis]|uniref:Class I SAM-dependent methyltransferase n=1 Tax=Lysobacter korlensis TaxID=553636 RepID=A0ABV6RXK3_9GAMM